MFLKTENDHLKDGESLFKSFCMRKNSSIPVLFNYELCVIKVFFKYFSADKVRKSHVTVHQAALIENIS